MLHGLLELEFPADQRAYLDDLEARGVTLRIVALRRPRGMEPSDPRVALAAMQVIDSRYEARLAALNPGVDTSAFWHVEVTGTPQATPCTAEEMLNVHSGPLVRWGAGYKSRAQPIDWGLANAVLRAPYGVRIVAEWPKNPEEERAYEASHRAFLGRFVEFAGLHEADAVLHTWGVDWSNFFDAGKEWFGSGFWTVAHGDRSLVLAISETD